MLQIRRATIADAEALASMAARTFAETFAAGSSDDDMALHLATWYGPLTQRNEIADPSIDVLLATDDDALTGYAQLRSSPAPAQLTDAAPLELWRFYVDRPWHGRGVAQQLMHAVQSAAIARGATSLWLSVWEQNGRAQSFYAKTGFAQVGTKEFVVGTDVQTDWIMACLVADLARPRV